MYDAMDAVSRGAIAEISRGSSAGSDEDDATPKRLVLRRAAFRTGCLLLCVLRNISTSATPVDLTYSAGRITISRLVTEGDVSSSEQNPKFVCGASDVLRKSS
jgi:hypothetical protein